MNLSPVSKPYVYGSNAYGGVTCHSKIDSRLLNGSSIVVHLDRNYWIRG